MNKTLRNTIMAIASAALIIFSINAFAHSGMGWGHHGSGWSNQGGDYSGITQEEYEQFEQKREAFFRETQSIRDNLYQKGLELESELAKPEPDAAKASRLQKDISELQSKFDQKRIEHMVEMRKLNPNAGRGYMYGNRMMKDRS